MYFHPHSTPTGKENQPDSAPCVSLDISRVPEESSDVIGQGTVVKDGTAYYGPGMEYKQQVAKYTPEVGTTGTVLKEENGWYCLEYTRKDEQVRVWLPADALQIS